MLSPRGESITLTNLKTEQYAQFICVVERVGAEKRAPSFKYCCGHILALQDLRLEQISRGEIREDQVSVEHGACPSHIQS